MNRYRISSGSTLGLQDVEAFIASLDDTVASLPFAYRDLFDPSGDLIVTRAPGRLDLMGGIGDYSGSLVLELPLQAAAQVAIQRNQSGRIRIATLAGDSVESARTFELSLDELRSLSDYPSARAHFAAKTEDAWAAYVAGNLVILMLERKASLDDGVSLFIKSAVPEGKGVSSSAAIEVASMQAIAAAYGIELAATDLALLCQRVENLIVGAPCGVMDQMTAACGEANRLIELLCQPADLQGTLALPAELEIWGIDSGIRHWIGGSDYRTVRTATFMGYRIITALAGLRVCDVEPEGHVKVVDPKWNGYLANLGPEEFEKNYADRIPDTILGSDFLKFYRGITDPVTSVEPGITYPVRVAASFPIYENARVRRFAEIIRTGRAAAEANALGEMMFASHKNYSSCGLGSEGTDKLVELVKASRSQGLFGAKITGGGSGGTVAVLGQRGCGELIKDVAKRYQDETGYQPSLLGGSSPGASTFQHLRLSRNKRTEN